MAKSPKHQADNPRNHVVYYSDTRAKNGGFPGAGFYVRNAVVGPDKGAKGPFATKTEALKHIDG